jgi:hypothetical protein
MQNFPSPIILVIATLALIGISVLVTFLVYRAKQLRWEADAFVAFTSSPEFQFQQDRAFESGRQEGLKHARTEFKSSDENALALQLRYEEGLRDGAEQELQKFHITYTRVQIENDNFFQNTVDIGYDMQIYYSGLPIGEPTRRITHRDQKAKDENIIKLLETVDKALETIIAVNAKLRVPISVGGGVRKLKAKA